MDDARRKARLLGRASTLTIRAISEFRAALGERDDDRRRAKVAEQIAALADVERDCRQLVACLEDEAERAALESYVGGLSAMAAAMRTLGEDRETAGRLH